MNMNQQQHLKQQQQFFLANPQIQQLLSQRQIGSIFSQGSLLKSPSSGPDTPGQQLITAGFDSGGWSSGEDLSRHLAGKSNPTQQSQGGGHGTGGFNTNNSVYQSPFFQQQHQYQSDSSEIERMFHKAYFEQVLKANQEQQAQGSIDINGGSIGNQDFASNEEELSSIEAASPIKDIQLEDHCKNGKKGGENIDKQIRQIMRVIGKLNQQEDASDDIYVEQEQQASRAPPNHTFIRDQKSNRNSAKDLRLQLLKPQQSQKEISRNDKSPLQKFLTTEIQPQIKKLPSKKSLLKPKSPISDNKGLVKNSSIPNLDQSPRFLNSQSTQQKIQSAIQALSSLRVSASGAKIRQSQSPISQKGGRILRSQSRSGNSKKKISEKDADDFLSQDLISRLFINHQKTQEVKDQKKYLQLQREVEDVKDRPTISPRSRDIALSSDRFHLPIYNSKRYKREIQTYLSRKEEAKRLKYLQERQIELYEEQLMNKSQSCAKLNPIDFLRKYNNQVMQWENRVRSGSSRPSKSNSQTRNEERGSTFHPQINPRSKWLAKDIERIENRVQKMQEDRQRKIEQIQIMDQPSFHPNINPISEMIAMENRRSLLESRQSIGRQSSSPMMKRYLSSMKEMTDHIWKDSNSGISQTDQISSRKSLEERSSIQSRLRDISPSNKLSKCSKSSKSSANLHQQEQRKYSKLFNPVQLSRPRQIQDTVENQIISHIQSMDLNKQSNSFLQMPIIANITQNMVSRSLNLMIESDEHIQSVSQHIQKDLSFSGHNQPKHEEEVVFDERPCSDKHIPQDQSQLKQQMDQPDLDHPESLPREGEDYIQGILSNTQNLEAYLQQYIQMQQSVNTQASSDGEVASVSVQQPIKDMNILQEYLKIKKEMNDLIENRQNQMIIEDQYIMRESQSTMKVQDYTNIIEERQQFNNQESPSEEFRSYNDPRDQYAIEFAGTLGPIQQAPCSNQDFQTLEQHNFTSTPDQLSNDYYQTSPTNAVLYTVSSSCETTLAADNKNQQLIRLHSMTEHTLATPGSLLLNQFNNYRDQHQSILLKEHIPSKELQEAESILHNIRRSLQSLNESPSHFRDSQSVPYALRVEEQDKESSSDSSSEEFIQRARSTSLAKAIACSKSSSSRERIEKKWNQALDSNKVKNSKDYKKIVIDKRKAVGSRVKSKKNQTDSVHQESELSNFRKESQNSPQVTTHRKSPTHAQIHRIPLEQQSTRLIALKSIGSTSSNPISELNLEQLAEETKQENSQALTYQSGGFMKTSACMPEDYSLNTWNSPTKGATTTSISQTMNQNYNNLRQYDSAFRSYLLQQLSDQKISEIALYVDQETKQMIENSRITLLQTIEKDQYFFPQSESGIFKNDSGKQDEIVKKLVLSNKKQFRPFHAGENLTPLNPIGPLNIPLEVYQEIEEYGLDTLYIIQSVIQQFQDVLDQSKNQPKMRLRQQMKSAEQKYQSSMFVTFNKSKPQ